MIAILNLNFFKDFLRMYISPHIHVHTLYYSFFNRIYFFNLMQHYHNDCESELA
jgi:hypothetical protein